MRDFCVCFLLPVPFKWIPLSPHCVLSYLVFILTWGLLFFIAFRERGRERYKYWYDSVASIGCLPHVPTPGIGTLLGIICIWTGGRTRNLGMCPDRESNPQPSGYGGDSPPNWAPPARYTVSFFVWFIYASVYSLLEFEAIYNMSYAYSAIRKKVNCGLSCPVLKEKVILSLGER